MASVAAGSNPVAHPIFSHTEKHPIGDNQDTKEAKAHIPCGPPASPENPSGNIQGQSETYESYINDRDFTAFLHNRHISENTPPDLAELIRLWPDLDPDTRRRLLALAKVRAKSKRR